MAKATGLLDVAAFAQKFKGKPPKDFFDALTKLREFPEDSIIAHISPKEAAILKALGGEGSPNKFTGLLQFGDGDGDGEGDGGNDGSDGMGGEGDGADASEGAAADADAASQDSADAMGGWSDAQEAAAMAAAAPTDADLSASVKDAFSPTAAERGWGAVKGAALGALTGGLASGVLGGIMGAATAKAGEPSPTAAADAIAGLRGEAPAASVAQAPAATDTGGLGLGGFGGWGASAPSASTGMDSAGMGGNGLLMMPEAPKVGNPWDAQMQSHGAQGQPVAGTTSADQTGAVQGLLSPTAGMQGNPELARMMGLLYQGGRY